MENLLLRIAEFLLLIVSAILILLVIVFGYSCYSTIRLSEFYNEHPHCIVVNKAVRFNSHVVKGGFATKASCTLKLRGIAADDHCFVTLPRPQDDVIQIGDTISVDTLHFIL